MKNTSNNSETTEQIIESAADTEARWFREKHLPQMRAYLAENARAFLVYPPMIDPSTGVEEIPVPTNSLAIGYMGGLTMNQFAKKYGHRTETAFHESFHAAIYCWLGARVEHIMITREGGEINATEPDSIFYKVFTSNGLLPIDAPGKNEILNLERGCPEMIAWAKQWRDSGITYTTDGEMQYGAPFFSSLLASLAAEVGGETILRMLPNPQYDRSLGFLSGDYRTLKELLAQYGIKWQSEQAKTLIQHGREVLREIFQIPVIQALVNELAQALITTEQYGHFVYDTGHFLTDDEINPIVDRVCSEYGVTLLSR